ncbi:MAG: DUF1292 domain-containing protein [Firmicutes bacterium]|nr:DUF1292 domain-containing protein [Bacillota bacterium]
MNEINTIKVKTPDGEIKEVEILNIYNNENNKYAIYSIDNNNDTSNLYAVKILEDENGSIIYTDINNNEKADIIRYIQSIIKG